MRTVFTRTAVIGLISLASHSPVAAQESCASPESCVEVLTRDYGHKASDRPANHMQIQRAARDAIISMDPVAVAQSFADVFVDRKGHLSAADHWDIAKLPEATRQELIIIFLQRDTDEAVSLAGVVMQWSDAESIRNRIDEIVELQSLRERISRLSRTRNASGAAGLALLLDETERDGALAHLLSSGFSWDAHRALRFLNRIDPNRADKLVFARLAKSKKPAELLNHYAGTRWHEEKNFAWLGKIWNDPRLSSDVRYATVQLLLDKKNPAPVPWSPALEDAIATGLSSSKIRHYTWHAILSLYRNDALDLFVRYSEDNPTQQASLLMHVARTDGLDIQPILPLVRDGLATRGDYEVTLGALSVWKKYSLTDLDALARRAVDANPFDFVQHVARTPEFQTERGSRLTSYGMRDVRTEADYCRRGNAVDSKASAIDLAQQAGVPANLAEYGGIDLGAVTTGVFFAEHRYIGYDRGEFGGGLRRYAPDGSSKRILNTNVQFIVPTNAANPNDTFWVMSGLNHFFPRGSLYRLDETGLHPVMRLPSAVLGVSQDGDSHILEFHNADREADRWKSYHPPLRLDPEGMLSLACSDAG